MSTEGLGPIQLAGDTAVMDGQAYDIDTLIMALQMQRANNIDQQILDQANQMKVRQDTLAKANQMLSQMRVNEMTATEKDQVTWSVDKNNNTIELDGYRIEMDESRSEWVLIKLDENGQEESRTRIWGDPHVDEKGDGSTDWDFKQDMTFVLEDGTKISVGTAGDNNGWTYSDSLTITRGDQRISVTGLMGGGEALAISDVNLDGREVDAQTADGFLAYEGADGNWERGDGSDIAGHYAWDPGSFGPEQIQHKEVAMTEEMREFLENNDIDFYDADGDGLLTADEWKKTIENLKGFVDSSNSTSQLDMIRLQSLMNKRNQAFDFLSNSLQKINKPRDTIIGNFR